MTTEELAERFQLTPEEFRRKLYMHARSRGLEVKSRKTATGLRFCLGNYAAVTAKATVVSPDGRRRVQKPELMPRIVEFLRDQEAASSTDIGREFFNGDGHSTRRYLTILEGEGQITSTRRGIYVWWSLAGVELSDADLAARTPKPVGNSRSRLTEEERQARLERRARKAREKRQEQRTKRPTPGKPRNRNRHAHCTHESTRDEQARCRREKVKAERKLKAAQEKLADEISLAMTEEWLTQVEMHCAAAEEEVGVFDPMDGIRERQATRRKETRERLEAEGKLYGWRTHTGYDRMGWGPTVYSLARFIHVRMRNDREHKGWYRFTYEWVNLHYPYLMANYRSLVDDALELLVIQGKIERLDMPVKVAVTGV
ncbi:MULTISPECIES: hypothetical protein [unclassified Streptomyces]|uniref:hypothetical protein n=1 Tax=unclassified Streptomyces TaxID=2593676 RepID=UPI0036EAAC4D